MDKNRVLVVWETGELAGHHPPWEGPAGIEVYAVDPNWDESEIKLRYRECGSCSNLAVLLSGVSFNGRVIIQPPRGTLKHLDGNVFNHRLYEIASISLDGGETFHNFHVSTKLFDQSFGEYVEYERTKVP